MAPGTPISKFSSGFGILPKISPNPYMRPNAAANYAAVHAPNKVVTASNSATSSSISKATNSNGLENLLSAAKRVFDPDAPSSGGTNPSKKRRVDQQPNGARETTMAIDITPPISSLTGQAMSALDVLADQAAAFGPEETDGSNSEDSDEPASTRGHPPGTGASRPSRSTAPSPTKKLKSTIPSRSGPNMLPSYSTYLPDYKSMLSNGPLPPAPDYSSPFGPRSDVKGKSKALLFPTTPNPRPGPVIAPYAPRPSTASATLVNLSPPSIKRQPGTSGNPRSRNTPNSKSSYSPLPLSATRSTSAVGPRESSTRKAAPTSRSSDSRSSVSRSRSTSPITLHRNLNGRSIHASETLGGQRRSVQEIGKVGLLSPKEINIDTLRPTSVADTYSQETTPRPLVDRTTVGTENLPLP
ncbi:hypothetical protein BS47DRAFT_1360011 [Hydnum rufescens UP504]|uniref:Uncharacterized protein n=1 Tax=Hydnum rufescens UP504 TaxID=1448309 RepID=A0A9P6DZI7_9AGAM|nr:hypothetical protein BS47DRAFT_1360011 [Hydnum rufescens UP504]